MGDLLEISYRDLIRVNVDQDLFGIHHNCHAMFAAVLCGLFNFFQLDFYFFKQL